MAVHNVVNLDYDKPNVAWELTEVFMIHVHARRRLDHFSNTINNNYHQASFDTALASITQFWHIETPRY